MAIVRVSRKQNPFAMIDKSIFEDKTISWGAKGIMGYLLSKPEDWEVNVADIVNHSPTTESGQKKRGNGEDAVYSILKELRKFGYAHHEFKRDKKGVIVDSQWTVFETKQSVPIEQDTDKPNTGKPYRAKPDTAKPDGAKPDHNNNEYNNNDYTNNENNNNKEKDKEKPPTSGAGVNIEKDFLKQTVEEQLREVWLYATKQLESVESEKISHEEKKIKRERVETVRLALMSEEFRGLIVRYREYRKAMKYRWYKSEATLYATVANLALLAGAIIVQGEKKINISNAKDIYNYSATEKNYQSFVELPKYLQTPKATQPTVPQPNTDPQKGIRVYGGSYPANL